MNGPLSHIRVLDLTRILAGPSCTQILADLGADVIKIERPEGGDDTRQFAPPYVVRSKDGRSGESAYFWAANRNKRSITLDVSKPRGQAIVKQLIQYSDVLVENFKTGSLAKYGLAYDQIKAEFSDLIYCSITGFGQTGPYANRPGYDVLIQGMSGFMSLTGEPDGAPMKSAIPIADLMSGMYAATSINAALVHRERTGRGQHIDIGMLDVMVAFSSIQGMNYLSTQKNPKRLGNAHPNIVPYQTFSTSDGAIVLAVGNDVQFQKFCEVAQLPELPKNSKFKTNAARLRNRDQLIEILSNIISKKTSKFWLQRLEASNVSCGPIYNLKQVFADAQVAARKMKIEFNNSNSKNGKVELLASPIKMSETPVSYRYSPPSLGQHTSEVLEELLGVDEVELNDLYDESII